MDKKILRKRLIESRKSLDKTEKAKWDKIISEKIINSDYFKNAKQVLIFSSTDDEFDTRYIIERCRLLYKRVFYPLCIDSEGKMEFYKVDSVGDLQVGMYNILEPKSTCKKYIPQDNDLVIVPCLSADRHKNRIGYGKGYYDRFLKDFNGMSVSPCYDILLEDEIPTDKYDMQINIIVTDKEVIQ
ncbi:MAG: 5-formyltetrahydrofolate cyclo-ligase [Clostridia bacterium]|nr:5-formyltetrahydrofolate cyclo-ligase [Clostridia bacterium]